MEKGETNREEFVKWFSELNKDSKEQAGGKGANLAEIYNLGVQVPPGFVVTAKAYQHFISTANIKEKIEELLKEIDYEDTKQLDEVTKKIRDTINKGQFSEELKAEIIDGYEALDTGEFDAKKNSPLDILQHRSTEPPFVAVRSSATAEDLAEASFAGQQDTFLNIKGNQDLLKHVKACFASLFTSRATFYRNKNNFEHSKVSLAVVVQKMVDSEKSGVIFSRDPSYNKDDITIEAVWGLGEGIVSGQITPDRYILSRDLEIKETEIAEKKIAITRDSSGGKKVATLKESYSKAQVLKNYEIKKLADIAIQLENHYKKPQDIEFAIEDEDIYIVQTRPITTMGTRVEKEKQEIEGTPILEGLAASPGIAAGKVKIVKDMKDLDKIHNGDILVTEMTNPDMVVTMQRASGIITDEGGLTAHAAIVSREMGIPCIVGTKTATESLVENSMVTVDGYNGKIYEGKKAETEKKEVKPVEVKTKTHIKVIVDLPTYAERAAKTKLKQVGLTRMEGIIAESGKHPNYFIKKKDTSGYEEILYKGIKGISKYFEEIWVRTSDIRSDEYQNLEGAPEANEANPMLGMHGIRFSVKHPEILKAELKALQRVAAENTTIGILMPQVISVEELQTVKKILKEINFNECKVGIMVETPAAVQLIKEFCEEGIDFISFGTNDLTQYILAIDRGNEEVQHLYDETHPAVLRQIEFVIRVCKKYNVESSICGQAGSKKKMVKFLVEKGINSISVNADVAAEIAEYVKELESDAVRGTDKEPRQYEVKKEEEEMKKANEEVEPMPVEEIEEEIESIVGNQEFPIQNSEPDTHSSQIANQESENSSPQKEYNDVSTEEAVEKIEEEKENLGEDLQITNTEIPEPEGKEEIEESSQSANNEQQESDIANKASDQSSPQEEENGLSVEDAIKQIEEEKNHASGIPNQESDADDYDLPKEEPKEYQKGPLDIF